MLVIDHISKRFGAVVALEDAVFEIPPHSVTALLGANGSGKSTLVKMLAGMLVPDSGTIRIDGNIVRLGDATAARKSGIAVAFQELSLLPNLTVTQNVLLGVEPLSLIGYISRADSGRKVSEVLDRVGLTIHPDELVGNLTSADLQLVEIAKALIRRPRFLVLDESTASLRHQEAQRLFTVIRELRDSGVGILFVSHRFEEIFDVCDTATVLCCGRSTGPFDLKTTTEEVLVSHMVGGQRLKSTDHHPDLLDINNGDSKRPGDERVHIRGFHAPTLKRIDLTVHSGEIVGIGGLQGQGQGVLLRGLVGAAKVRGEMVLDGRKIKVKSPHSAARRGILFISGDRRREGIFSERSLEENIAVTHLATKPLLKSLSRIGRDERVHDIMQKLQVVHQSVLQPASALSGGNQQKLLVGRALYQLPKLLVLDDPTKGVDVNAREEIHRLLRNIAHQGVSILLTSSDDHELAALCHRIIVFYGGQVAAELQGPTSGQSVSEASIAAAQGAREVQT